MLQRVVLQRVVLQRVVLQRVVQSGPQTAEHRRSAAAEA